ncbi:hypothetical protein QQ045_033397 [Rhodiola kirilowii]
MKMRRLSLSTIFHVLIIVSFSGFGAVTSLGINYGQLGSNLPHPEKAVTLLKALRITKTRIYDTNPNILRAFANTGIEVIVTVENNMMATLSDPMQALQWVNTHIAPYYPATKITGIAVGNEVFSSDTDSSLMTQVVQAMTSIHQALVQLGLHTFIHISTPNSLAVLSCSYPPSAGAFKPELSTIMVQFLQFLEKTNSPFWINAYPFFTYKDNPSQISLDYVLMNSNTGMVDPYTNLHYDNMLYAQVDAVIFAMSRIGFKGVDVRVSETGWPSNGDTDEAGATLENAAMYTKNMLKRHLLGNEGTPLRPQNKLDVYLFALFNENLKPGPGSERNYGLYHPDGTLAYNVGMSTLLSSSTFSSSTSPGGSHFTYSATEGLHQSLLKTWMLLLCWLCSTITNHYDNEHF